MVSHERLYEVYDRFDTNRLRALRTFLDVFPPIDSPIGLEYWDRASTEFDRAGEPIRSSGPDGELLTSIAARVDRDQAFTALDLARRHDRQVNVLVLDVDETLRSAGGTDNEIPRETLSALTRFYERETPIVICTGQTVENVKGFAIQGLGSDLVHSGRFSIVYESGAGVFTPGHGEETKQLLYDDLDDEIRETVERVRNRLFVDAPEPIRRGCHLQGNEFNVTLKSNYETGTERSREIVDNALVYLLDRLGDAVVSQHVGTETGGDDPPGDETGREGAGRTDRKAAGEDRGKADDDDSSEHAGRRITRSFYADSDPEIHDVLAHRGELPDESTDGDGRSIGMDEETIRRTLERIDVAYYEADAAEVTSLDLDKARGVERAFEVLSVSDPFALVMGDSKTDLRVMEWVASNDAGISAAPTHASQSVLDHVDETDELRFPPGASADILKAVEAMNRFVGADEGQ